MSRQYLKELQGRAQKLLQASSDQEEQVNAYTASQRDTKSAARIDLEDMLSHNSSDSGNEQNYFPRATDVQLLKKCIALTNDNKSLQLIVEHQKNQISHLELSLSRQQDIQVQTAKANPGKNAREAESEPLALTNDDLQDLQREILQVKKDKLRLKRDYEQLQHEKQMLRKEKEEMKQLSQQKTAEIQTHNDYTIKTVKNPTKPIEDSQLREYQLRIQRSEAMLRQEKQKVHKLCYFINSEVPKLKDALVHLTAKLDLKVSKHLLRDLDF